MGKENFNREREINTYERSLIKKTYKHVWFLFNSVVLPLKFLILKKYYGPLLLLGPMPSPCSPL